MPDSERVLEGDPSIRIRCSEGRVRVEAGALFAPHDDRYLEKLITHLFRLEVVRVVDVDRVHQAVVIDYDRRHLPVEMALEIFAEALRGPDGPSPLDALFRRSAPGIKRVERRQDAARDGFSIGFDPAATFPAAATRATGAQHERVRRLVNLALGGASFLMSIVGIMTPFVPTMPFVLATGYFLANSSPTLHDLFRRSPLFGEMLGDWEERGGWRRMTKLKLFVLMAFLWGVTLVVVGFSWPLIIIMGLMSSISIVTILRVPTILEDRPSARLLCVTT